ncbi:MAG: nickel pincer cofactor biosynthesis protein LarB [Oscillospiraceae bacterium]|jgi:NCAIR mutase (PurE)-related protein|nr:nickel pincer cofactor biosynthesis protein LarB [Oscillospiraceae bacterium]
MNQNEMLTLLEGVKSGQISTDEALLKLKVKPFEDLGYAKPDHHRSLRQGAAEVIYGERKSYEQICGIAASMLAAGTDSILITRLSPEAAEALKKDFELQGFTYYPVAKIGIVGECKSPQSEGKIIVATGGTSDIPVAEEAALTAEFLGSRVLRLYDVGVSGLHRLLSYKEELASARVVIAIAGMEGALASVIGGLTNAPVIGVPTSVGYGASFGGVAALLSMLNSCASGVSVVNIDNGFGAGYIASMINKLKIEN